MILKKPTQIPEDVKSDLKSIAEEYANTISHAVALGLAGIISIFLLYKAAISTTKYAFIACLIFCLCSMMAYLSSTLYHGTYLKDLRKKYRIFDHISIYFLIAGSYTPFILMHVRTQKGLIVLGIAWIITFVGAVFKYFYTEKFKIASTLAYLVMGWMAFFIKDEMTALLPDSVFTWIVIGGLCYTFGIIFYLWRSLYHSHLLWHIFVMGGTFSHFVAVYYCLN